MIVLNVDTCPQKLKVDLISDTGEYKREGSGSTVSLALGSTITWKSSDKLAIYYNYI